MLACVRACVRTCVRACVRACVCGCAHVCLRDPILLVNCYNGSFPRKLFGNKFDCETHK